MNNNSVRYNDVFKVLFQIREPISLREISKRVAARLNSRQQDIEDNVARIVQSGVAIGLLVKVGDAYSYYTHAAKLSPKSLPIAQEPDVAVQAPDNDPSLPSSVISLSHSGSIVVEPKDDLAANILANAPSPRRSRSTQRVSSYRSQAQAPAAAKSTTESAKRNLSSTRSQDPKRAVAQKSRTQSLHRDEEPCSSSTCRPVVTRERIADLMASAGLDPRSRPFRVAETLLADELNRDSQEEESGAEDRHSDDTNTASDDDDSELMFDGVLYNGCGHASTTNGADISMQCPLETPEDCPACQRRKQMASRKRRQKSKMRNKSRSKSKSKRRRR